VVIWDCPNLYHSDVYETIGSAIGGDFYTVKVGPDYVGVRSESEEIDVQPFTDEHWLPIFEKSFAKYYPGGVKFEEFYWW
jgi:hypothetical protein